ncbi:MAG: hypothetical protein ABI298_08805, partial [Acidimicrobiales bacterium]
MTHNAASPVEDSSEVNTDVLIADGSINQPGVQTSRLKKVAGGIRKSLVVLLVLALLSVAGFGVAALVR